MELSKVKQGFKLQCPAVLRVQGHVTSSAGQRVSSNFCLKAAPGAEDL